MFFYEGQSCPVCGQPFQETDDIVACPQCGAPHHRECWKKEGQCHYAAAHGTPEQWKRPEPQPQPSEGPPPSTDAQGKTCPHCGKDNPQYAEFCARCGKELPASDWASAAPPPAGAPVPPPYAPPASYGEYAPFRAPVYDAMGGIPIKEEIEDGVTAGEVAQTVGVNTAYYVPRFHRISRSGSKVSWNWSAFLITPCWLVYRKNFLTGGLTLLFWIARQLLSSFISLQYISPLLADGGNLYADMLSAIDTLMQSPGTRLLLIALVVAGLGELLLRIFFGLFGNYFYMRNVIRKSKKWQTDPDARYHQNVFTSGGVSFGLGTAAYMCIFLSQYLLLFFAM